MIKLEQDELAANYSEAFAEKSISDTQ